MEKVKAVSVNKANRIRLSRGEKTFSAVNGILLVLLAFVTLYPFLYIIFASLSDPEQFMQHEGLLLWTKGFSLKSYQMVFRNPNIGTGYMNTIFYVLVGSVCSVFFTAIAAYVLSRKGLMLNKYFMAIIMFTMYFNGGMIPNYLLIKDLHLMNSRWAVILPVLISTWNLIVMLTSFRAIPVSLEESARIDGAGEWTILFRIIIPLSLPIIMVMFLYYGVAQWNAWFNAMLYIRDRIKFPLQLFLREILIASQGGKDMAASVGDAGSVSAATVTVKYATIIVSTLPVLCIYPFIQKYFVQGVLIGAVKE